MTVSFDRDAWISKQQAARALGVSWRAVETMIREGHVAVRSLPGSYDRVFKPDIEALAQAAVRPRQNCA